MPVFSVDTDKEARALLTLCCRTDYDGQFIASELAEEQTLENLQAFSDRLAKGYERIKRRGKR